ncbi:MAG: D-arabitol-phosphate dehydrogenase [Firmicutes bacterium ADurb.Bin182]|nr:MAG: D-arabitol-phosphate dehydrogenase [Firmicutes bacterium ADurb.Bin182]
MKALVYFGARDLRYVDVDTPRPKKGEVLVKPRAVSICGSDLSGFKGTSKFRVPPLIMGHEFSGEIAELGEGVKNLSIGQKVGVVTNLFCGKCPDCKRNLQNICDNRYIIGTTMMAGSYNGAMADFVPVPAEKIVPLPEHVSFAEAALAEPLSISLRAVKHAGNIKGKTTAVFGAGPIGLLAIKCLKMFGAKEIIAIDIIEKRLDMAKKCGATAVINSNDDVLKFTRDLTCGEGLDFVLDAVGIEATINKGIEIVRNGGNIIWIGLSAKQINMEYFTSVCKEINIKSSYMYTTEMNEALDLISSGKIIVKDIITNSYPMSKGPEIFAKLAGNQAEDVKVILTND